MARLLPSPMRLICPVAAQSLSAQTHTQARLADALMVWGGRGLFGGLRDALPQGVRLDGGGAEGALGGGFKAVGMREVKDHPPPSRSLGRKGLQCLRIGKCPPCLLIVAVAEHRRGLQ